MSISLSAITTTTSAFIDLQSPPRILISSARFFRLPPAAKTHLLRLCCTDSTHTSVSLSFFFNFFWLFLCVLSCSHPHWNCFALWFSLAFLIRFLDAKSGLTQFSGTNCIPLRHVCVSLGVFPFPVTKTYGNTI